MILEDGFGSTADLARLNRSLSRSLFQFSHFFHVRIEHKFYFAVLAVVRVWVQMDVISKISQYLSKKGEKV
jgi:hypothetical protein